MQSHTNMNYFTVIFILFEAVFPLVSFAVMVILYLPFFFALQVYTLDLLYFLMIVLFAAPARFAFNWYNILEADDNSDVAAIENLTVLFFFTTVLLALSLLTDTQEETS